MIVWDLIGIGICVLVLCSRDSNKAVVEKETTMSSTTSAQLIQMLADDERDRRRRRFEAGISPAQHGRRVASAKIYRRAAGKQATRREQW